MIRPFDYFKKVAITTGDSDGVGLEITCKALLLLPKNKNIIFFLFRPKKIHKRQDQYLKNLDRVYKRLGFNSLKDSLKFLNSIHLKNKLPKNVLIDIALDTNPAEWVLEASLAAQSGLLSSLVTGPLSKKLTSQLVGSPVGHTGILRALNKHKHLHMGFVGRDFSVVLATDHISLPLVESNLNTKQLKLAMRAALNLKNLLESKKKINLLGLNPHAGEQGLIGSFEKKMHKIINLKYFTDFMSPDAAFLKKNISKNPLFLALYHDQGLIPFKMHHGQDSGVHITLGLDFIRTSVDHGTAKDIFNKNLANPNSMLDAIMLNIRFLGEHNV